MRTGFMLTGAVIAVAAGFLVLPAGSPAGEGAVSLRESIPLKLRYEVGETLYYRLVRHTTLFTMDGSKFGEQKAVAYFTRTRLDDDSLSRAREEFTWRSFAFGQSMQSEVPPRLSYLKEAEDFSLVCSVQDEDLLTKFDFSALPRTIEGFWFMVMTWDAVTFDGPVRAQEHFPFPDEALLGAEMEGTRGPYDFKFEFPPLVTNSSYAFSGKHGSRLMGLCIVQDIPCAVVEFSYSENRIVMNFDLGSVRLNMRGLEHIWGKTYLSLEDGRIVKGELVAPVAQVQDMQLPGENQSRQVELLALQRLNLDGFSREQFNLEVKKCRSGKGD